MNSFFEFLRPVRSDENNNGLEDDMNWIPIGITAFVRQSVGMQPLDPVGGPIFVVVGNRVGPSIVNDDFKKGVEPEGGP